MEGAAGGGEGEERQGPGGDGREVAVRRGADPDGGRGQYEERGGPAGGRLVGEGAQRDEDRGHGGGADGDAPDAGPAATAQTDAVQADEGQHGGRGMPGDMGGPVIRRVVEDVLGEAAQRRPDVVEAADDGQVLVRGGEPAGDTGPPAVYQRQRARPGHGGGPARQDETAPGQPGREGRPVNDHHDGDHERGRGAGPQVREPRGVQRRPVDMQAAVGALDDGTDDRGNDDEEGTGRGGRQIESAHGTPSGARAGGRPGSRSGGHGDTLGAGGRQRGFGGGGVIVPSELAGAVPPPSVQR